uniref:AlNc14C412G11463 protein n=1 Tax=Albugo laibachii Nc14 TaxID=890382 RepID=F0W146_9STRA|nr:AlNc14C6G825 [Albugo laibachii Nc14]CCA26773.1 AlNc14C412G11463 [Albugo laibachii Nc14]|eukprot:CCA26773.1 AlNc14C412G11463 [Albugo laibachii Nc14]
MADDDDQVYQQVAASIANHPTNFCAADLVAAMVMFYPKIVKVSETLDYRLRTLASRKRSKYTQMHAFVLGSNAKVPAGFAVTEYHNRFVQMIHDDVSYANEDKLPAKVRHDSYFMREKEISEFSRERFWKCLKSTRSPPKVYQQPKETVMKLQEVASPRLRGSS